MTYSWVIKRSLERTGLKTKTRSASESDIKKQRPQRTYIHREHVEQKTELQKPPFLATRKKVTKINQKHTKPNQPHESTGNWVYFQG